MGQQRSEGNYRRASSGPLRGSAALTGRLRRQGRRTTTGDAGTATRTLPFLPSACAARPTVTSHLGDGDAPRTDGDA
eukprot:9879219-Alexandrium_andersonii.AAC.1